MHSKANALKAVNYLERAKREEVASRQHEYCTEAEIIIIITVIKLCITSVSLVLLGGLRAENNWRQLRVRENLKSNTYKTDE